MSFGVEDKIREFKKLNPGLKTPQIIAAMVQSGAITASEAEKISAFIKTESVKSDVGTILEHQQPTTPTNNIHVEKTPVTEEQAQDLSIEYLSQNLQSAIDIYRNSNNGVVSNGYDAIKNLLNTELSSENVGDVLNKETDCIGFLIKAKSGKLTKREYYEQNKERLKEMILKRFNQKDDTGVSFLDKLKGNYSEEEFTKVLDDYLTQTTDTISTMKGIKDAQHKLLMQNEEETTSFLSQIAENAKQQKTDEFSIEGQNKKLPGITPEKHPFESDEPMTFEETFELERGTAFNKTAFEDLQQSKGEMNYATGAHNKNQELKNNVKILLEEYAKDTKVYVDADGNSFGGSEPSATERAAKISNMFKNYYSSAPDNAKKDLDSIIKKQNLDLKIEQDESGEIEISFGELYKNDTQKNRALNTLLRLTTQQSDKKLTQLLGGKSYESYIEKYQQDYSYALGQQNADELSKAMKEDQMTVVQKYSGIASMGGMAVMVVGGILTVTPAAPLGAGMVATGGKIAMSGMAAKNILGFTEELTRKETSDERMTDLTKDLVLDLGGLIIGGYAGRQGLKYASGIMKNSGDKVAAMIAEKGTDFTISIAGDLAMIGALNYDEGLAQTLQNNGIGIVVSTLTGLKASKEMFKNDFASKPLTQAVLQTPDGRQIATNIEYDTPEITPHNKRDLSVQDDNITPARQTAAAEDIIIKTEIPVNKAAADEMLSKFNEITGLKDMSENVKTEISQMLAKSNPENVDSILKKLSDIKNIKLKYGSGCKDFTDAEILNIIKMAEGSNGAVCDKAFDLVYKSARSGPDCLPDVRILRLNEELALAKDKKGVFNDKAAEIVEKSIYLNKKTREELINTLKDSNGEFIDELLDITLKDPEESLGEMDSAQIINVLKKLKNGNELNKEAYNHFKPILDSGCNPYLASTLYDYKTNYPDIYPQIQQMQNEGHTFNDIDTLVKYAQSHGTGKIMPDKFNEIIKNASNIPELKKFYTNSILNKRLKANPNDNCNQLLGWVEKYKAERPEIEDQFIKLLHIEGRTEQFKAHDIFDMLLSPDAEKRHIDIDKLMECGLFKDIEGRKEPLKLRDFELLSKYPEDTIKKIMERKLLTDEYKGVINRRQERNSVVGTLSNMSLLSKMSDEEFEAAKEFFNIKRCGQPLGLDAIDKIVKNVDTEKYEIAKELLAQNWNQNLPRFSSDGVIQLSKLEPEEYKRAKELFWIDDRKQHQLGASDIYELAKLTPDEYSKAKELLNVEGRDIPLTGSVIASVLKSGVLNGENYDNFMQMIKAKRTVDGKQIDAFSSVTLSQLYNDHTAVDNTKKLIKLIGKEKMLSYQEKDLIVASNFVNLYKRNNINEIPSREKKILLRNLVKSNAGLFDVSPEVKNDFPILPTNKDEYCSLLPSIVRSIGIETDVLTSTDITKMHTSVRNLSSNLAKLSDSEFNDLKITQEYNKDQFIQNVLEKVKTLPANEKQKVYDYFGFELHRNKNTNTGYEITGYPANLNNGKKLAQISDTATKEIVESIRKDVIKFTKENRIICNNKDVEAFLNETAEFLPEIRTAIEKTQHGSEGKTGHSFDLLKHSLKVMQKISQDEKFNSLDESDKKIMLVASLLHDITKSEGRVDKTHSKESAFDTFFIAKKFNLTKDEEVKLYDLIKNHEWLAKVNINSKIDREKAMQSVAFDLRKENLFDMALMFTHADLKAVKTDDSFHDRTDGRGRIELDGKVRSFGEAADIYAAKIKDYISTLQKTQPLTPCTKIPSTTAIRSNVSTVNPDGSTNIKGLYIDKENRVIIKFNEVEDWTQLGFPEGTTSKGIKAIGGNLNGEDKEFDTGNLKFFVHGLDYPNQLAKFDAFSMVDSDALLSVSYAERPESKNRFFRPQGVILDIDTENLHAGGAKDAGSGCGKDIDQFKRRYIFGGDREVERVFLPNLIKKALGLNDEQYVDFINKYKGKSFNEIEDIEVREKIIKAYAGIKSNIRNGKREYNEMYATNPKVMGIFVYDIDYNRKIDNPIEFLNIETVSQFEKGFGDVEIPKCVKERTAFLKEYASERDLPIFILGN